MCYFFADAFLAKSGIVMVHMDGYMPRKPDDSEFTGVIFPVTGVLCRCAPGLADMCTGMSIRSILISILGTM
ncbi:MAG: hypothetical protein LBT64_03290 [Puniceicoccales bacterium]|nr:hypothetical protein [Puniceicoccales bacterium]